MRVFVAIPLSKELKENLTKVQSQLKDFDARISWVDHEIFHLTLEFLGDVEETKIPKVSAAIEKGCCGIEPFELALERLELVPNIHHPRVIAVSVGGDLLSFQKLKNQIRVEVETLGFKFEQEKTSHITLGRIKEKLSPQVKNRFLQITKESRLNDFKRVNVRKVVLTKSTLTQVGPIYTPIVEIRLR